MKYIYKLLFPFLSLTLLIACSVDDGGNGNNCTEDFTGALETRETKLVGSWILTAITSDPEVDITTDGVDNPSQDIFAQRPDCLRDAEYTFEADRGYVFSEGQNFTDCSNQLLVAGSWKFTGLTIDLNSSCAVQIIPIRFNDDSSEFSYTGIVTYPDVNGNNVQTKTTFVFTAN